MIYLQLFWEFFKTGLFAIGGGLATIPFLKDISLKYPWFTPNDLLDMIAVSESTPGPLGVNSSTYAGFHAAGVPGALVATCSLVLPSVIIIILISRALTRFRDSRLVQDGFYGLRPASTALIASAGLLVAKTTFLAGMAVRWPQVALAAVLLVATQKTDWHPVIYIAFAAVVGVVFHLGT